jgi:site-specific recombinase XerD
MQTVTFSHYLASRHLQSTQKAHEQNLRYYLRWLAGDGRREATKAEYADLLEYVHYEKSRGLDVSTINLRLASIRIYYAFLITRGIVTANPASGLYIRGKVRKVVRCPLTPAALDALYQTYSQAIQPARSTLAHHRNIVMAGLLVYQGLHSGELRRLETGHLQLEEGRIYIPGAPRSNGRELPLRPAQILALDRYLHQVRPRLHPRRDELLPGSVRNHLSLLIRALQQINPGVTSALHIRASVFLGWLTIHNKRQVQYMAGHKHIDSTERFSVQQIDVLTDQLSRHHPFG